MNISETPFPANNPSPQQLRKSALRWQLAALDEQLGALRTLDKEHSFGIENSAEVAHLVAELHDLLRSAEAIAQEAKKTPAEQTAARIQTFHQNAKHIKEEAARFNGAAMLRAKLRLNHALEDFHSNDLEAASTTMPPADADKLSARASNCCFSAESSQYTAFAMQINAMCDLALEMIYNSAAEVAQKSS